jgi:hypothetical protein
VYLFIGVNMCVIYTYECLCLQYIIIILSDKPEEYTF